MELRAGGENKLTAETAAEAVEAWRSSTRELLDSTTAQDEYPRKAWSHMAVAQANLLIDRNFLSEGEETLRWRKRCTRTISKHRTVSSSCIGKRDVRQRQNGSLKKPKPPFESLAQGRHLLEPRPSGHRENW
jgi:hypothetical protein